MMDDSSSAARIMVVDDDADTLAILAHHVKQEGFVPLAASSGSECLRLVREHKVDLVLLDLMMPDMDGFEVCKALRDDPDTAEIPIILVTARDDIDARAEGMRLGVSDFLAKPVLRRQLANRIRAQLKMVAMGREALAALNRIEKDKK
jgi:DNA-binding response OmpR family regulator